MNPRLFIPFAVCALVCLAPGCSPAAKSESALDKARAHLAAGRLDEAEIEFKNAISADPKNPEGIALLGGLYLDQGRLEPAVLLLRQAIELRPDDLPARINLAKIHFAVGQMAEAAEEANYVLERKPADEDAPLLLVNSLRDPKDVEATRQRLLALPAPAPEGYPVLLALGTLEFRQRRFAAAEAHFQRAEALAPNAAAVHSAFASLHLAQRDRTKADPALKKAAELSPPQSPRRLQYALFKLQTNEPAAARAIMEEMLKAFPQNLPALIVLGQVSLGENKLAETESLLNRVLAKDRSHPEALLLSSQLDVARKEFARAVTTAESLTGRLPRYARGHQQLALAQLAAGQNDKAELSLERTVELNREANDAKLLLAGMKFRKGDFAGTTALLKGLVELYPENQQAATILAEAHRSLGELPEALAIYEAIDKRSAPGPQTPYLRALIALRQNRRAEARQELTKALEITPGFYPAVEQVVALDLDEKDFAAAQRRVDGLLALDAKQARYHVLQARVHGARQDGPQVEAALRQAIAVQPDESPAYLFLANLQMGRRELPEALATLKGLLDRNRTEPTALMMTAAIHEELTNYAAARTAYETLTAANPRFTPALMRLAMLQASRLNAMDQAIETARKAREVDPADPRIADLLGWLLLNKKDYARGLELIRESADKLPGVAEVQFHLGMALYIAGEETGAKAAFERALQINPNLPTAATVREALQVLAIGASAGPADKAMLERAVTGGPDNVAAQVRLAALYEREGDLPKAAAAYERALQTNPAHVWAAVGLIELRLRRGETARAHELGQEIRRLAPRDSDAARVAGRAAFRAGNHTWAASLLLEAAMAQPNHPGLKLDLALASYSVGRTTDAEASMRSAIQTGATGADLEQARRFLDFAALLNTPAQAAGAAARVQATLQADPADVPALMVQGLIEEQKPNPAAARQTYEKALATYPAFTPAMRRLAILLAADPQAADRAMELGLKAREAYREDAELTKALGIAAYHQKNYQRSAGWMQEATAKLPNDGVVQFYLGRSQVELKQAIPARAALLKSLQLGLPDDLAAEARRLTGPPPAKSSN